MRHDSERVIEFGHMGEEAVARTLREMGYHVLHGEPGAEDLVINGKLTIEVKTANLTIGSNGNLGRWQFCLFAHPDRQQPFNEDLLILRCECSPPVHFVIPGTQVLFRLSKIDITSKNPHKYQGKWARFREGWEAIEELLEDN